ncbi:Dihydrodipicolinate synthase [Linderina macrospora]|uniref:Dihydrodipicolinate synthase n=1 Tax=Linderina macrospora TaxID=4868 RepID=A0ACC1J289_9FUNG|nr:Dihydrodipicolinate synthase [Linderina macrospora]
MTSVEETLATTIAKVTEAAAEATDFDRPSLARFLAPIQPSLENPTHLILILLTFFLITRSIITFLKPATQPRFSMNDIAQKPIPAKRDFTPRELSEFDGRDENTPLYMAVKGTVYDVSNGRSFYGPGGPYANFAGRDASRGLALGSFDKSTLTDLDAPLDDLEGLDKTEIESLDEWATFFAGKYLPVGKLVPNPTAEEKKDN